MFQRKIASFWLIPFLAWLVYASAYLGRINLSVTIPYLQSELGYSKASLGFLASGFFIFYAAGQLINGILGDRLKTKSFVSIGLLVAGISNIAVSYINSFPLMLFFWSLNGYFQSMLWGPLLRAISEAVPHDKQYQASFLMSTSPVAGIFLAYILSGWFSVSFGWALAFRIPGIWLIIMSLVWYRGASESQVMAKNSEAGAAPPQAPPPFSAKELFNFIYQSRLYLAILLGILVGIVKEGLILWSPSILNELYFHDMAMMLFIISLMPLVNFASVISGGILYKKFHSDEQRVILLFLIITILSAFLMWRLPARVILINIIVYYVLMASLYAVNTMMMSYIPIRYRKSGRVSGAAGIVDSSIYLGAALAGPVIGAAAERFGWNGIFGGLLGICILAVVIQMLSMGYITSRNGMQVK